MEFPGYINLKLGFLLFLILEKSFAEVYKAAVMAYKPIRIPDDVPDEVLVRNKKNYVDYIYKVREEVDIIIFPENGLTTNETFFQSKVHLDSYSIIVPDPKSNFSCSSPLDVNNALVGISCAAQASEIYVVCNVVEKVEENGEIKYYSTNVVFDLKGRLILKCRRKYPHRETNFDKGDPGQSCMFDATFKDNNVVKFAVLFDTDLLFYRPEAQIYDVILISSIRNMLPLSYGLSLQLGYSVRNKVNLLTSEYTDVIAGYGGSGIYLRNGTSRVIFNPSDPVMIGEIPNDKNEIVMTNVYVKPEQPIPKLSIPYLSIPTLNETFTTYSYNFNKEKDFCKFDVNLNGNNIIPYKWVAFYNKTDYLGQEIHLIVCALTKPEDQKNVQKIVNKVNIYTNFSTDNVIQLLPISLDSNMLPANFQFEEKESKSSKEIKMTLSKEADLLIFGVVGVLRNEPSSSSSIYVFHIYTVGFLSITLSLWSKYLT